MQLQIAVRVLCLFSAARHVGAGSNKRYNNATGNWYTCTWSFVRATGCIFNTLVVCASICCRATARFRDTLHVNGSHCLRGLPCADLRTPQSTPGRSVGFLLYSYVKFLRTFCNSRSCLFSAQPWRLLFPRHAKVGRCSVTHHTPSQHLDAHAVFILSYL